MNAPKFLLRITYLLIILYLAATTGNFVIMAVRHKIAHPQVSFSGDFYLHIAGICVVIFLLSFLFRRLGTQDGSPRWG